MPTERTLTATWRTMALLAMAAAAGGGGTHFAFAARPESPPEVAKRIEAVESAATAANIANALDRERLAKLEQIAIALDQRVASHEHDDESRMGRLENGIKRIEDLLLDRLPAPAAAPHRPR